MTPHRWTIQSDVPRGLLIRLADHKRKDEGVITSMVDKRDEEGYTIVVLVGENLSEKMALIGESMMQQILDLEKMITLEFIQVNIKELGWELDELEIAWASMLERALLTGLQYQFYPYSTPIDIRKRRLSVSAARTMVTRKYGALKKLKLTKKKRKLINVC
uniref:Uncharacterized protein n=1 Tax=Ditylenchus dipsaci TaxID=166011 RepID=A0A915E0Y3_9BILA